MFQNLSFSYKIILFVVILLLCLLSGVFFTQTIMLAAGYSPESMVTALENGDKNLNLNLLRLGLGISHIVIFILSSMIFANAIQSESFGKYFGISSRIDFTLLFKLLTLLLMIYPISGLLAYGVQQIDLPDWASQLDQNNMKALESLLKMDTPLTFIFNLVIIALLPGIGEEMLFRGVIQNELQKHLKPASYWPMIIAAFIFAAFHGEIVGLLPKFLIGLVLGYAYYITGNLLVPMLMHAINNGAQVAMVYFLNTDLDSEQANFQLETSQIIFILLTIPFIIYLIKNIANHKHGSST